MINLPAAAMGSDWAGNVGSVGVAELDWSVPQHAPAAGGPFDVVLAADCVYHEEIVEEFLRTVLAIVDQRSTGGLRLLTASRSRL
jgi:hypothetical protein